MLYSIRKNFCPSDLLGQCRSYMGLNVTFNYHGMSTLGMRAFEVLYLENDVEFD